MSWDGIIRPGSFTAETLRATLIYDPETGIFTSLVNYGRRRIGATCGTQTKRGYVVISVCCELHLAHRLAWLYMIGEWPLIEVDHEDLDKSNNRWGNLRLGTHSDNGANRPVRPDSKTGIKGVTWHPQTAKWMARITRDSITTHLGLFMTAEEAHAAYTMAAKDKHGRFARAK